MATSIYREVATDMSIARRFESNLLIVFKKQLYLFIYMEANFHENLGNFLTGACQLA